ncbi:xanthine dehydrogenase family protein molybdopterin-binding subunit [Desertimonas flava]|jgi:carbon-monoxide dehydrogenase large subunit|uniref:xanthine dehydrogenase family protein molybdopterin-binding subunit n=1 Tax=Desertimonas flava TaxID=2064846 RepID=UPI000E34201F|nr:xanthine dehydrogenase family protein molybdopterin-binding subunit [Desertimonas flava]
MSSGPAGNRFVGQRVQRREDARLLTGHGTYVDDVSVAGMLHVAFVRSDVAAGTIVRLDTDAARELPGVVGVFSGADINHLVAESWVDFEGGDQGRPFRMMAEGDVRFAGEPLVMVVAESRYVAEDACELVEVEIDPIDAVVGVDAALAAGARPVHPDRADNVAGQIPAAPDPELDRIFEDAERVVTETFHQHRYLCVPMECRGIVSQYDAFRNELVVHTSTQGAHGVRGFLSRALQLPENRVRVVMGDVGGGFGQKMFMLPDELAVVIAGKLLGRPVKWIEDRRENLLAGQHARNDSMTVSVALDADARILGVRADLVEDVGAFPAAGSSAIGFVGLLFAGPYRIPKVAFSATAAYSNTCGRCSYRGPWMMETVIREQMMDHVARELGIDPLELRRRNVVRDIDLPYTTAAGLVYDRVSIAASLEQAVSMIGYDEIRAEQARARAEGRCVGVGLGLYVEPSGLAVGNMASEGAVVSIGVNGQVQALMSSGNHGQSLETTIAQVVADRLGVSVDDVTVVQGDTASAPFGPGTGGSRSAVILSGAADLAADRVRAKVVEIAAHHLEAAADDLVVDAGAVSVAGTPTRSVSIAEVARMAYLNPAALPAGLEMGLEEKARYSPDAPFTFSNSCHACLAEVDPRTGEVRLLRYVVSEDCGVMINPDIVEGQIAGGVVQGIGGVLYEHMVYDDDGNPLSTTFVDYLLPTAAEVPVIEYGHIETPAATNPGGYKGMGEGGAIGAPPAVINAVADAVAHLGARLTRQPLTPMAIHLAMADSR